MTHRFFDISAAVGVSQLLDRIRGKGLVIINNNIGTPSMRGHSLLHCEADVVVDVKDGIAEIVKERR